MTTTTECYLVQIIYMIHKVLFIMFYKVVLTGGSANPKLVRM